MASPREEAAFRSSIRKRSILDRSRSCKARPHLLPTSTTTYCRRHRCLHCRTRIMTIQECLKILVMQKKSSRLTSCDLFQQMTTPIFPCPRLRHLLPMAQLTSSRRTLRRLRVAPTCPVLRRRLQWHHLGQGDSPACTLMIRHCHHRPRRHLQVECSRHRPLLHHHRRHLPC